jgi:hypothetical protein
LLAPSLSPLFFQRMIARTDQAAIIADLTRFSTGFHRD